MQSKWYPGFVIGIIKKNDIQIKEWKKLLDRVPPLIDRTAFWVYGILIIIITGILLVKGI